MLSTRLTTLFGCRLPIQQAGMSAAATPELAAAVSNAGAFGMLGAGRGGLDTGTLSDLLQRTHDLTSRPFGVNFLVNPGRTTDPACFEIAAKSARVVEFFYGWPDADLVAVAHKGGALAVWQVGSKDEAIAAQNAGCDAVVAQGIEAGGHVRGRIGLLSLLRDVLSAVSVPVIAAGGIGSGREMAAALVAGASGVRIGTRFLAAQEAGVHPDYLAALIAARSEDTIYTDAFSVGWPDAPHRVLKSCLIAAQDTQGNVIGERTILGGLRLPVSRFECLTADRTTTGNVAAMSLWAGESVGAVTRQQTCRAIVDELSVEAKQLLKVMDASQGNLQSLGARSEFVKVSQA